MLSKAELRNKILTECGLVNSKKDGAWVKYNLKEEKFNKIKELYEFVQAVQ